jgi:nicotinamide riboside kinase
MRIAFTGAHSTGKTTLLRTLQEREILGPEYVFVDEITRKLHQQGLPINTAGNNTTQILIMSEHIKNTLYTDCVLDRSVLDGYIYTKYLHNHLQVDSWVLSFAETVYKSYNKMYDLVFYIQPEFPLVTDGVRDQSLEFQKDIAQLFETYIGTMKSPVITLTGTVEQRIQTLIDYLP